MGLMHIGNKVAADKAGTAGDQKLHGHPPFPNGFFPHIIAHPPEKQNGLIHWKVSTAGRIAAVLSLPIYLNHRVWTYVLNEVSRHNDYPTNFLYDCLLTLATALISIPLSKGVVLLGRWLKRVFFKKEDAAQA